MPSLPSNLATGTDEEPEAEPVDTDPYSDMLVLGFQEPDLSTEALLYSTSSIREDAWSLAVFTALGEKAIFYSKVPV
jgi:phosphatidylinositol-bisphosphatase